jgi:hypothetical protein
MVVLFSCSLVLILLYFFFFLLHANPGDIRHETLPQQKWYQVSSAGALFYVHNNNNSGGGKGE